MQRRRAGTSCCRALSERLGKETYFFGCQPTPLDALVYGHLYTIIITPLQDTRLASIVNGCSNLVKLTNHVDAETSTAWRSPASRGSLFADEWIVSACVFINYWTGVRRMRLFVRWAEWMPVAVEICLLPWQPLVTNVLWYRRKSGTWFERRLWRHVCFGEKQPMKCNIVSKM